MKYPKVSIILTNYNKVKYLKKSIESVLNQTYRNFELIIIDDASTDGSDKIIKKYIHLKKVKYLIRKIIVKQHQFLEIKVLELQFMNMYVFRF